MPNCRKCNIELSWPQSYEPGARPVNKDGTNHDCGQQPRKKKKFRFEGPKIGGFNPPLSAKFGNDRCNMCKYNYHPWCDRGVTKECMGFV